MAKLPPDLTFPIEVEAAVASAAGQPADLVQCVSAPVARLRGPLAAHGRSGAAFTRTIHTADALGLLLGALLAASWAGHLPAGLVGLAVLTVRLAGGGYRWQFKPSLLDDLPHTVALLGTITMATASVLLLTQQAPTAARGALQAGGAITLTTLLGRAVAYVVIRRLRCRGVGFANAVVVGAGETGTRLAAALGNPVYGVRVLGFVDENVGSPPPAAILGSPGELRSVVAQHRVDLVLVSFGAGLSETIVGSLRELGRLRYEVFVVPRLFELHGRPKGGELIAGIPLVPLPMGAFRHPSWPLKRLLDVSVVVVALILTWPVMALIAVAVRFELGPAVIFKQQRVGMDGKSFTLYKFRSLATLHGEGDTRWCIDGDPRLGPVGRFIRSTSLDELPQLVNVLKGHMSLVGPRPERPFFVDQFSESIPGYRHRHRVPVGLTGFAAVNGLRGDTSIPDRARFDNLYIDSWSLWLDVQIILRTIAQFVRR